ncbi:MAG: hypothetical protein O2782_17710, partial [bacterium]|nr:hypothetical protein [bacterium]
QIVLRLPGDERRVLTPDFAAAADPCVSFDGQQVLFAGRRRSTDGWEIWRMQADGSNKRQVSVGMADARGPVWLAPAAVNAPNFDDRIEWITFTSTAKGVWDERRRAPLANLYAMSLAPVGARPFVLWQTTYGLGGDRTPTVLADGRVLFASWQRQGYGLMTISWAGENLNPFYGSHDGSVSQLSPVELPAPSRDIVFVEATGDAETEGGRLAAVSMRRPLHSWRLLADDGAYRTPAALPEGGLVVAWRGSDTGSFGLYQFDLRAGRGNVLVDDPAWHEFQPVPLVPRSTPRGRIPTVDFASVLDVEGFKQAGQLQCLNVYESDRAELSGILAGSIRRVRLVEGVPLPILPADNVALPESTAAVLWPPAHVQTRSLGEAPVEADGSFYVNVAGDRPFYLETLDENGGVVGAMRSWMWVRAGDQRGCVGCHENKELTPENRVTDALRRARPMSLVGDVLPAEGAP